MRCPKNVNFFKLMCIISRLRWHSIAKNLLRVRQMEHLFRNLGFMGTE